MCFVDVGIKETLENCNLTDLMYFHKYHWIGNGSQEYCNDPKKLYDQITRFKNRLSYMKVSTMDSDKIQYYGNESDFSFIEYKLLGSCLSYKPPKSLKVFRIFAVLGIRVHAIMVDAGYPHP